MKTTIDRPCVAAMCIPYLFAALCVSASAAVRFVDVNSASPTPPYTNWATAASVIQDAVDAAEPGDGIAVTNGVYEMGGRALDAAANRVVVDKPLEVRSVNGPQVTVIDGGLEMRCVYLTEGAMLSGFTLTNGAASGPGGGVFSESATVLVSDCVLSGNSADIFGGGAYGGTLNGCVLSGNSVRHVITVTLSGWTGGGGAAACTLNNCTLTGNSAVEGGGAYECTLNNCTLNDNSAWSNCFRCEGSLGGGGASESILNNCTLIGNSAGSYGGGVEESTLSNCALFGNLAGFSGGGAHYSTLANCTITGNSSENFGGGVAGGHLNNCIVYFNNAPEGANYSDLTTSEGTVFNYSCTTPLPTNGVGNFTTEPQLASTTHLSAGSPCRGAGNSVYATGKDIDGELWADPPSVGCDEPHPEATTGPPIVAIQANPTYVAIGREVCFTGLIVGNVTASRWEFDDGSVLSNQPYVTRIWLTAGVYPVTLRAYNQSHSSGVSATVSVFISVPRLTDPTRQSDGSVVLSGLGPANESVRLWSTTDLSFPLASWWMVTTGAFDINGNFSFKDWDAVFDNALFYRLSIP